MRENKQLQLVQQGKPINNAWKLKHMSLEQLINLLMPVCCPEQKMLIMLFKVI